MAESPAESPSKPSVRLLEFETDAIIKIIIGIIINHKKFDSSPKIALENSL